jgi:hypothetical protein
VKTREARELGKRITTLVQAGEIEEAEDILRPILAGPLAFRLLDQIGAPLGRLPLETADPILDWLGQLRAEGAWVVIASALRQQIFQNLPGAMERARRYIIKADIWYATDIFGERVPGPALVEVFQPALEQLESWREDCNRWVRRSVGVAIHFWAKRRRAVAGSHTQAQALLEFLTPVFNEKDSDAVKGFGWGLKTLGRYYPDQVSGWLDNQAALYGRPARELMLRKTLTYLPAEAKLRFSKPELGA